MIKALILAHDFPPLNSIGARRPASWYNHFHEFGVYPVVIAKAWGNKSSNIRDILEHAVTGETRREKTETGELIIVPVRLSASERLIVKRGENSWVIIRKMLTFLSLVFAYPILWFDKNRSIYVEARKILATEKIDCIIATGEPFILFKYAFKLSKEFKIPWIADYRDGWFLNHVNRQDKRVASGILRWWEFWYEKKYIRSCTFITSVDPLLCNKLQKLHRKPTYVVYNGFEKFVERGEKEVVQSQSLPLVLSHAGTIYPGHSLEILLDAIHELHEEGAITPADINIYFLGTDFFPDQKSRLLDYKNTIREYIFTTSRLPNQEVIKFNLKADILLVFTEKSNPVIPAKTYEYISLQKKIVAILNDHSILEQLITKLGAGTLIEDKDALKLFLLQNIELKRKGLALTKLVPDIKAASFYLRKNQTGIFAKEIKKIITQN